jgi:D-3-phosphoglycerate dehydrogenase
VPLALLCGLDHANVDEEEAVFRAAGVRFEQVVARTADDYLRLGGAADALLVQYGDVGRRVFDGLPRLRLLVRYGVGVDGIDLAAATERGIPVVNVPDYGTDEVANHAVALLLALARKLPRLDRQVRAGGWDVFVVQPVHRLAGRTVGIVGCGRIGRAVARKLAGFDVRLLVHDPYLSELPPGVTPVSLEELLAASDYVTVHCPLTAGTRHLIGRAALARMKPTAVLVNTARGPVVDEEALARALEDGALFGAGIDVYEREPEVHPRLLAAPHAVLLPHIGSASEATRRRMAELACEGVVAVLAGEAPPNLVTP